MAGIRILGVTAVLLKQSFSSCGVPQHKVFENALWTLSAARKHTRSWTISERRMAVSVRLIALKHLQAYSELLTMFEGN